MVNIAQIFSRIINQYRFKRTVNKIKIIKTLSGLRIYTFIYYWSIALKMCCPYIATHSDSISHILTVHNTENLNIAGYTTPEPSRISYNTRPEPSRTSYIHNT